MILAGAGPESIVPLPKARLAPLARTVHDEPSALSLDRPTLACMERLKVLRAEEGTDRSFVRSASY